MNLLSVSLFVALLAGPVSGGAKPASGRPGPSPEDVGEAERRLSEMGYMTGPVDSPVDELSRYALLAFQRVEKRKQTGQLNAAEIEAIKSASRPKPLEVGYPHIEVDISRQVLFVVDAGGTVSTVLPVSTGSGKLFTSEGRTRRAVTPRGTFRVSRKIKGWRKSPLGLLYYPNYLVGGVAIHGSREVPNSPSSHGCIRIPMPAARQLSDLTPEGAIVIIHD